MDACAASPVIAAPDGRPSTIVVPATRLHRRLASIPTAAAEKRKEARDAQLTALLSYYPLNAGATREDKPIHLLAEDVVAPGRWSNDARRARSVRLGAAARSKIAAPWAPKALDNFVMDATSEQALHERAQMSAETWPSTLPRQDREARTHRVCLRVHAPIGLVADG